MPTEAEWADAELAWRLVGWVKTNSIVLVKDGAAWGIGAGQQNRVEAGQIAAAKAAGRAAGGACASDAFYPFPDGIEAAAEAGVAVIIQPGGSVKDDDNIATRRRARRRHGLHRRTPLPALVGAEAELRRRALLVLAFGSRCGLVAPGRRSRPSALRGAPAEPLPPAPPAVAPVNRIASRRLTRLRL